MSVDYQLPQFNLIVTHLPGKPAKVKAIRDLKEALGDFVIVDSRPNIIISLVDNALGAVKLLRERLPRDTPILRVIPVSSVTLIIVDYVEKSVRSLVERAEGATFAIRLDGKLYDSEGRVLGWREAIERIASGINKKVNLSNPDILVYIKTVKVKGRSYAAIYEGSPQGIMSTVKEWE